MKLRKLTSNDVTFIPFYAKKDVRWKIEAKCNRTGLTVWDRSQNSDTEWIKDSRTWNNESNFVNGWEVDAEAKIMALAEYKLTCDRALAKLNDKIQKLNDLIE